MLNKQLLRLSHKRVIFKNIYMEKIVFLLQVLIFICYLGIGFISAILIETPQRISKQMIDPEMLKGDGFKFDFISRFWLILFWPLILIRFLFT